MSGLTELGHTGKHAVRSPVDLLKALASTVKDDPTASHYKYHDDPYLMPASSYTRQTYALGKEAGRKAARYFAREFPTLFMYDKDEPRIMSYRLPKPPQDETGKTEEELVDRMRHLWVQSAVRVYENMMAARIEISEETLLRFLEFLCYFNCTDPEEFHPEQNWLRFELNVRRSKSVWKHNGCAMKIFDSLQPKSARAYSAVICGMAKYLSAKEASEYFVLMREEGLKPDAFLYNRILCGVCRVKSINSERWENLLELLRTMKQDGVRPNADTFNSVLAQLRLMKSWRNAPDHALEVYRFYFVINFCPSSAVFQEMVSLQLQPTLGTYVCLIDIFQPRPELQSLLDEILDQLEGKHLQVTDPLDELFFPHAMSSICEAIQDPVLAYRLHTLLNLGHNEDCITSFSAESSYYESLLTLISRTQPTDEFFKMYYQHVPRHYSPGARFLTNLIHCFELTASYAYFPQVWSEIVYQGLNERTFLETEFFLAILRGNIDESQLMKKLSDIAWDAFTKRYAQYTDERVKHVRENQRFTARLVVLLSCVCSRAGDFDRAWHMLRLVLPSKGVELTEVDLKVRTDILDSALASEATELLVSFLAIDDPVKHDQLLNFVLSLCEESRNELCEKLSRHPLLSEQQKRNMQALQDHSPQ
ncbi:unnamed protein product [Soboliphyme baturini]|uniref:Small ribosomal subunit protein mS39 n=1 Tax=Soboliphyme baturini TaxID=241478 RepID=A0A183INZ7_9BILA|nr:unnamed protein product [Soboliphyme baturini]